MCKITCMLLKNNTKIVFKEINIGFLVYYPHIRRSQAEWRALDPVKCDC